MKFYHLFMVQLIKFRCLNYCDGLTVRNHRSLHAYKKNGYAMMMLVDAVQ